MNVDYFWEIIGIVDGVGNFMVEKDYCYFDRLVEIGLNYYCFMFVDVDGSMYLMFLVLVIYSGFVFFEVYLNFFCGMFFVSVVLENVLEVYFYDLMGMEILVVISYLGFLLNIDVIGIVNGVYNL